MKCLIGLVLLISYQSLQFAVGQTLFALRADANNFNVWYLSTVNWENGNVQDIGIIEDLELPVLLSPPSLAINQAGHTAHIFEQVPGVGYKFYTISLDDAEVISSPTIESSGWRGLQYNPNDTVIYAVKGWLDDLGSDLVTISEDGAIDHIQHTDAEAGLNYIEINTVTNVFLASAVHDFSSWDGKYYVSSFNLTDSIQSSEVQCDFNYPNTIYDLKYHPWHDEFYALMKDGDDIDGFASFDPASGSTQILSGLKDEGIVNTSVGGGLIFKDNLYVFAGFYTNDSVKRVFSIDIETGDIVKDPELGKQVNLSAIGIDQSFINGIWEKGSETSDLNVFPNPASDLIRFDLKVGEEYKVIDALGRVVGSGRSVETGMTNLDVKYLDNGVYYVRTQNSGATTFVVSR